MSSISSIDRPAKPGVICKESDEISEMDRIAVEALRSLKTSADMQSQRDSFQNGVREISYPASDSIPQVRLENSGAPLSLPSGRISRKRKEPSSNGRPRLDLSESSVPSKSKKKETGGSKYPPYESYEKALKDYLDGKESLDRVAEAHHLTKTSFRNFRTGVKEKIEGKTISKIASRRIREFVHRYYEENKTKYLLKKRGRVIADADLALQYEGYKKAMIEYTSKKFEKAVPPIAEIAKKHQVDSRVLNEFLRAVEKGSEGMPFTVADCRLATFRSLVNDLEGVFGRRE